MLPYRNTEHAFVMEHLLRAMEGQRASSFFDEHFLLIDMDIAPTDDFFIGGFYPAVVNTAGNLKGTFLLAGLYDQRVHFGTGRQTGREHHFDFLQAVAVHDTEVAKSPSGVCRKSGAAAVILFEQLQYIDDQFGTLYIMIGNRTASCGALLGMNRIRTAAEYQQYENDNRHRNIFMEARKLRRCNYPVHNLPYGFTGIFYND